MRALMDSAETLAILRRQMRADGRARVAQRQVLARAFVQEGAVQCGYCTPGFVMTTRALLNENPTPTLDEVKEALSGNLCRCGCYAGIASAVLHASEKIALRRGQG